MAKKINTPGLMPIQARRGEGSSVGQALGTVAGAIAGGFASGGSPAGIAAGANLGGTLGGAVGGATGDQGSPSMGGMGAPSVEAAQRRMTPQVPVEDPIQAVEKARLALGSLPEEQQKEFGPILAAGQRALRSKLNG